MSITISGIVTNGVVVPNSPIADGTRVEIHVQAGRQDVATQLTPAELRRMSRQERQAILAAAAVLAEADYRDDKDLTGFDA